MNAYSHETNLQHDQARLDAQVLRSQALAEMWAGMSQHLAQIGRLTTRLTRPARRGSMARPFSRS